MKRIIKFLVRCLIVVLIFCSLSNQTEVRAQAGATTANINGVVTDEQGAVIGGATVLVLNLSTNLKRDITADENGSYKVTDLPPGSYKITVIAEGLQSQATRFELELGVIAKVDFSLKVASQQQEVIEVVAQSTVQQDKTESSTNQDKGRIDNLPINQRDFLDFALTSPRVTRDRIPPNGVTATSGLSFNGQSARLNNVQIDGSSNNEQFSGGVLSTFSQDAVQEFQIVSDSFSAEFGRASGGVVNIVTKSGTNDLHGRLFNFIRTDETSAKEAFSEFKPDFKQYQFGGTLSGPIKKDKAFFFLSFERLSVKQNNIVTIPDDVITSIQSQRYPEVTNGPIPFALGTTNVLARADAQLTPNARLTARYNGSFTYNGAFETTLGTLGGLVNPTAGGVQRLRDNAINISNTLVKGNLVNESRFLFVRRNQNVSNAGENNALVILNSEIGQLAFGKNFLTPQRRFLNLYQFVDNITVVKGRNQLKFGVDFSYTSLPDRKTDFPIEIGGFYVYAPIDFASALGMPGLPFLSGLQAFDPARRSPDQVQFLNFLGGVFAQMIPNFPQLPLGNLSLPVLHGQFFGTPSVEVDQKLFSTYIQEEFRVKPNLLLKAGVRYDIFRQTFTPNTSGNFSPRLAFSYKPVERATLHGSYGIFFQGSPNLQTSFLTGLYSSNRVNFDKDLGLIQYLPFPLSVLPFQLPNHQFPTTAPPIPIPQFVQNYQFDPKFRNSYTHQYSFGFNYLLDSNTLISVDYNGVRGLKLLSGRYINPVVRPVQGNPLLSGLTGRVDPTNGFVLQFEGSFDSYYHGLTLSATRRLAKNVGFLISYTFSKGIDNYVDFRTDIEGANDSLNIAQERGLSLQDIRSRFVASGTWDLAYTKNLLLRDFQLSMIVELTSGRTFNLQAGADLTQNSDLVPGDRPPSSGTLANYSPNCGCIIGRNAGRTPGFASVDLRLTRSFTFAEKYKIQGFLEVFNLFNRVNISQGNFIYSPNLQGNFNLPNQDGGRYILTPDRFTNSFAPRQTQLGFRLSF